MSTEDEEEKLIYEAVLNHFKSCRVEISHAITHTFPFLHGLRDRGLITDRMFQDAENSWRNMMRVEHVVYDVLEKLEKFDETVFEAVFNEVNLQEYPKLVPVRKSFEIEVNRKLRFQNNVRGHIEENSRIQLPLEQEMSTEDEEEKLIYEAVLNHFKSCRVEISHAITHTFPFLHGLRDRGLITDRMFQDAENSWRNMMRVEHVVYDVLEKLEKFDETVFEAVFSEVNLQEYPKLVPVRKSFEIEVNRKLQFQNNVRGHIEENSRIQLPLEQGNKHFSLVEGTEPAGFWTERISQGWNVGGHGEGQGHKGGH
ncbi:component of Sp100-rs-like [Ochotona curzoniae]|uniref:component of Sp100-rs-like n=1 Tax=Ochotona curzoniae TaxID=130825 RepID=UPI001B34DB10|nr:component of Sp100-rs-like [Ochotona curzoniae]